ncbi:hypothetical protein [Bacillus luti]|nr:hypothetical protein [Bacillus luti]
MYPAPSRANPTVLVSLLVKVNYKTASDFSFLITLPVLA